MSAKRKLTQAPVFAALGDETRLSIVSELCRESPQSITSLTDGAGITRQAITKHLRVLEGAGIVRAERAGRETRFRLVPDPLVEARAFLDGVSAQWDRALGRLKSFVEE